MPRLIDGNALRELIDNGYDVDFDELPETKQALLEMIDYQDTVDAVEVVRCRDCVHWEYDAIFPDGWCRSRHQGNPDWFCADGEREK